MAYTGGFGGTLAYEGQSELDKLRMVLNKGALLAERLELLGITPEMLTESNPGRLYTQEEMDKAIDDIARTTKDICMKEFDKVLRQGKY